MESYRFLLDIALILLSTKVLGLFSQRLQMPQVVGALTAGLLLGPAVLGVLHETEFLSITGELGVIMLMFTAGMETRIEDLKRCGRASFIIALAGVLIPLAAGFGIGAIFNRPDFIHSTGACPLFLQNVFLGIILTATSVSITVETLRELGRLQTPAGTAILGAAIIDDVLGIIALTIVTGFADSDVNILLVLGKIVLFFLFAAIAGVIFSNLYGFWTSRAEEPQPRHAITAFFVCLLLSFLAEVLFGVADITGAFAAGLFLSNSSTGKVEQYLFEKFESLSMMYLSPIFFAGIGLKVVLDGMSGPIIMFAVLLSAAAVLSKIAGCGLGAYLCRYTPPECLQIGVGMVSRGEVALIVASKGEALGLISREFFGPVIVVVVVTTIITPILLKLVFRESNRAANVS